MELIVKHQLYEKGMGLFDSEPNLCDKFWLTYGNYLNSNSRFNDAGNAYLKSKEYKLALSSFQVRIC